MCVRTVHLRFVLNVSLSPSGNGCSVTLSVLLMLLTILQTSAAQTCPVAGSILDCSAAGLTSFPQLPLDVQQRVQAL